MQKIKLKLNTLTVKQDMPSCVTHVLLNPLLRKEDFSKIASIHKYNLGHTGFISDCSIKFISLFYGEISNYNSTILIIDKDNNLNVKGFIFCTTNKEEYYQRFFLENLFHIILYPSVYYPFIKAFFRKKKIHDKFKPYHNELVHIATDSKCQGQGVGQKMIKKAEQELISRGVYEYYLQVFSDNDKAIRLYKFLNFEIVQNILVNGKEKYLMRKELM